MRIPFFDVSPREMDSPSLPPSLWAATAEPAPQSPPLRGDSQADVAVVGGGFAGLSTALHLVEAGASVTLLEAAEPGWGASGRNGGQVIPGLKYDPDELERMFAPLPLHALQRPVVGGLIHYYRFRDHWDARRAR